MPQINRFSSRWIIAIITAISTAMMFAISAPQAFAKEYVTTTGLSPDGNQYSIGWEVPSAQEPARRSKRSTKDYAFETNQLENGMQTLIHIENSEAPTEYRFPLSLPQEAEVIPFSEGSEDAIGVFLNGSLIATIATPWAIDANGTPLQTSLHIENGTLVQIVEHNSDTAFPCHCRSADRLGMGENHHQVKQERNASNWSSRGCRCNCCPPLDGRTRCFRTCGIGDSRSGRKAGVRRNSSTP